ncbi:MAG: polysaccharide biosynthesis protein [Ignavibacteriaceae bacterium]
MNTGRFKSISESKSARRFIFIFFDLFSFVASLLLALFIRAEFKFDAYADKNLFTVLVIFLTVKFFVFFLARLYNITWSSVSIQDLAKIAKASLTSSAILCIIIYGFNFSFFNGFPRSVLILDLVLTFIFSSGFKIAKRMYLEVMRQSYGTSWLKRTLIIGAGSSGEQIVRDILKSKTRKFFPIGFIDDDPVKQNLFLQGIKVLGTTKDLPGIIRNKKIDTILISVLSADRNFHRKILNIAKGNGVSDVKVISTINDISNEVKVSIKDIRDIDVSDLIGRQAVSIDTKIIGASIKNKKVLITGAAGSIGSEISRQIASYDPRKIAILDINESDLVDLEIQLSRSFDKNKIKMYLCDISDLSKVERIFEEFDPEIIFHAAAYKHVPVLEHYPEEAARVNVLGTYNLAETAKNFGVENFILISTDKAVNPTSILGASKRIAEYIVTGIGASSSSKFIAVRFGNVIGSRGSALPIFIDQLKNGGPITVTHPEMKRYFMTISEAVSLVLQASANGENSDVFILDMGAPVKIIDIVRDLIHLNNLVEGEDIQIEYTGIREGEKLFEEILTAEEGIVKTAHQKIFKSRIFSKYDQSSVRAMIAEFNDMNAFSTKDEWVNLFKYYVPSFNPAKGNINNESIEKEEADISEIFKK